MKVLIVDDEKIVRIALKTMVAWEDYGFQLIGGASDGLAALKLIEREQPDIVITDLKMPKLDGLGLIAKLQENRFPGKTIVLSNYGEYELVRKAMKLGAFDYLLKITLKPDELLELLRKAAERIAEDRKQKQLHLQVHFALKENQLLLKRQFLYDLLHDGSYPPAYIERKAKELGIAAVPGDSCLLRIEIERFESALSTGKIKDKELLGFSVGNIVRDVLSEFEPIEVVDLHSKEYVVLMPAAGGDADTERRKRHLLRKIPAMLQMYLNLTVSAAFSEPFNGLERMRPAYESLAKSRAEANEPRRRKYRKEVNAIIDFLEQHHCQKITLEMVAQQVSMNESYLCRLFKNETGKNIINYLNDYRMERARKLLTNPDLNVREVAASIGIENQFYFNRMFRKYYGQSPSEFKKKVLFPDSQNS
ncbi:helix-turn-helix domain-containing protein [Paenibacillus sp. MSJ-34]|uniref:response regulator n=2 Tax=unclassified Paenibacillus TaxID=185978 RepID=UPI001C0F6314|nr:helix-turn-helix domain-containing protein [Paenibacillus sp. MSJ-34]MBU5441328.1 response regulator [Paenibacillus sp. MSJ-34]